MRVIYAPVKALPPLTSDLTSADRVNSEFSQRDF